MIVPVDAVLRREVEVHVLRFTCEACAHFEEGGSASAPRCSLGFPHAPHLSASFEEAAAAEDPASPSSAPSGFLFCKAFELG